MCGCVVVGVGNSIVVAGFGSSTIRRGSTYYSVVSVYTHWASPPPLPQMACHTHPQVMLPKAITRKEL